MLEELDVLILFNTFGTFFDLQKSNKKEPKFHFDVEMTFPYQFRTKNYNLIKLSSHSASEFDTPKSDKRRLVTSGAEQENSKWEELLC